MFFCRHGEFFLRDFYLDWFADFLFLAEGFQIGFDNGYVVPMDGSCAWWASNRIEPSLKAWRVLL